MCSFGCVDLRAESVTIIVYTAYCEQNINVFVCVCVSETHG